MIRRVKSGIHRRTGLLIDDLKGWKSSKKILVIESDDWGGIRMPNKATYNGLLSHGLKVDKCHFSKYDTLASIEDFEALYEVLVKHRDKNGKNPIITANTIVANPDFKRIKESNFEVYHYELFTTTIQKYPLHSFDLWRQGIDENIFYPQFHGREHLQVKRWLANLRRNSPESLLTFENEMFGIGEQITGEKRKSYQAALDIESKEELPFIEEVLIDGLNLFEDVFGYRSTSFVAPNHVWPSEINRTLANQGISHLQGSLFQLDPFYGKRNHYTGKINDYGQVYSVRNVLFEPSLKEGVDWVNRALLSVDKLFKRNRPAIVNCHRVNFIGGLCEKNRTTNLKLLDSFLTKVLEKWPDTEFMNSSEFGRLIREGNK